ncbi:MAG: chemotaxis protein CheX [Alphaproteobacteria bacterium]|jgi:chemotaxis protein CheC|nr:chemotaxis protein CheX [Rhizobiaceae bacterium]MBC7152103.1 chemotaxis protein CheX [Rhizobium sp.]MBU3962450.1 chemotaxis protein CheX [Alphaproteobacteria bacterium]MBU4048422.1 chemotaxis protein CheX [Alphaproteobacteria bacterium]MBU4087087.1 chemotaxis protein CheX [Alphaproteobacteria bacterium]
MNAHSIELDELELDALTELVNIGVSRAAASLRKMVNRQVTLSVPSVEIITRKSAAALIGQRESELLIAVQQQFEGPFSGRALLIFPESNGLSLVRAIVGEDMGEADLIDMKDEALAETGNVILNGCLGSMANMLQHTLNMSLPDVRRGDSDLLFEVPGSAREDSFVLFLYINFSVHERDIRGYIAMIMDLPSLEKLKLLISNFIDRVMTEID